MAQTAITDTEILEAALIGLEHQRSDIDERMADLRRQIGIHSPRMKADTSIADSSRPGRKGRISAAARRRIAAAQRKRWAEFHATKKRAAGTKAAAVKKSA